jgi:hypothetical protein
MGRTLPTSLLTKKIRNLGSRRQGQNSQCMHENKPASNKIKIATRGRNSLLPKDWYDSPMLSGNRNKKDPPFLQIRDKDPPLRITTQLVAPLPPQWYTHRNKTADIHLATPSDDGELGWEERRRWVRLGFHPAAPRSSWAVCGVVCCSS